MKKQHIHLTANDKETLKGLISEGALPPKGLKRAAALLELGQGKTFKEVAKTVKVASTTVSSWASKYEKAGLSFLKDKPRPGRPKDITAGQRAKILALANSEPLNLWPRINPYEHGLTKSNP